MKYLNRHVVDAIANGLVWFNIGVDLLGDDKEVNVIRTNHPGDNKRCATEMLQSWLAAKADASWNQLMQTLKQPNIKLENLALTIEGMLSKGSFIVIIMYTRVHTTYTNSR